MAFHDVLGHQPHPLDAIFRPRRVAVVGASEKPGSVGRTLLWNLIQSPFGGTVYPVNPRRESVLGIQAYPNLHALPEPVDLVVIAIPAPKVPAIIADCVALGIRGAIVLSAGFKEIGPAGQALEAEIQQLARQGNLRLIGPNCLGLMNPLTGLNATFADGAAQPGNLAFISQSGALCTSILDWSRRENVGFSAFVSIGSMLDVSWGDLIYYFGDDPHTQSIVLYMESIGQARSFLSAAREVALSKPIIVIKAGRTAAAAQAAASHTGALAGSDAVLDAAFQRCGVLRVDSIDELFSMSEVLAKQPRPKGRRLTILTNAGGPGVLATDALIQGGGSLAPLAPETITALDRVLPAHWSHGNPIDVLGDATADRYGEAIQIAAADPNSDGLLVILTPQAMTDPSAIAQTLADYTAQSAKPILASWMGGDRVATGEALLNRAHISTFAYPDAAARTFNLLWQYSDNLNSLYETPTLVPDPEQDPARVEAILEAALASDRTLLSELESKQILAAYGIPTIPGVIATTPAEAVAIAEDYGYPVVAKLHSHTITHKSDVGGVQLNLQNAIAVEQAFTAIQSRVPEADFLGVCIQPQIAQQGYELIVGASLDPQFGPVLLFGSGGRLVEVYEDRALGLPPLNTTLAERLMEKTRIWTALQGIRGQAAVDLEALKALLVRFSRLVLEQPRIREIEINPLLATPGGGLLALDARVVLHPARCDRADLPRAAIRPYPSHYQTRVQLKDGQTVQLRPIRPEDEPLVVDFHRSLSEETVYRRYAHLIKLDHRIRHTRLTRVCFVDYDQEMAIVAEREQNGQPQIIGIGRLSAIHGSRDREFAITISDAYQDQGLGRQILSHLIAIGRAEGCDRLIGWILQSNRAMIHLAEQLGFSLSRDREEMVEVQLPLQAPVPVA
ncbi:bifunctional acetate--CoA ligase family protein/GNAT family N-acetyltransferase [Synechococcus elongatus]|uniref:Bifunctional acetate--CoA ligase family protein/GNAT family N-acetyltransferase n=1 Tax=Synechococcus elongatus PCC 11802 TaxID=2283154 RepID=A0AAT9JTD8_SYNEL|nr:bifunctional acetate--CoA ligase family protein/GNAT family N-acetyltransferase [Synechococcus elongatus]QFZ91960.1 bifunctional acyl-CoA synthetase/GNAT family N-acetyltransferase [Synechococcus elongatus PCC 11802]